MQKRWKIIIAVGFSVCIILPAVLLTFWLVFAVKIFNLPSFDIFLNYNPKQTAYFYSRNEKIIGCITPKEGWKDPIAPEKDIGEKLLVAKIILNAEDRRFYERDLAIDVRAIGRAIWEDMKARKIVEGGSTIPQQLVKQLLPEEERSKRNMGRKIKEFILAWRVVKKFTKDEIFTLYLNEIFLGHQHRGIEAASLFYYNKHARELTPGEAATIAALIKSPNTLSPKAHPEEAKVARDEVLDKLYGYGKISQIEYEAAKKEPIATSNAFGARCNIAPHAMDEIRAEIYKTHNLLFNESETNSAWYGLRVITTLDEEFQELAVEGVHLTISEYEKRQGENAVDAEGAFVAIENNTGAVVALVGGKDYSRRKFNHAVHGKRQIGSAFKPIVYLAKFEQELTEGKIPPEKILKLPASNAKIRCPRVWRADPNNPDDWWEPKNFDDSTIKYNASFYPRYIAIAQSINLPALHTAQIDKCRLNPRVIEMARRLGLQDPIPPYLPSALGASSHSLIDVVRLYSVLPNRGFLRPLYMVTKISDTKGKIYFEKKEWEKAPQVISATLAAIMLEGLRGTVKFGTAAGLNSLAEPVACKTGTTQNYTDALLFCFTPGITIGAWMGGPEDYSKPLGLKEYGARWTPGVKYILEQWYRNTEPQQFLEESEEWKKYEKNPELLEKQMQELEKQGREGQIEG